MSATLFWPNCRCFLKPRGLFKLLLWRQARGQWLQASQPTAPRHLLYFIVATVRDAANRWGSLAGLLVPVTIAAPVLAQGEALRISYIEKPPYYFTDQGKPKGFLVEKVRNIMDELGLATEFVSLPPRRALMELETNRQPNCSIGWFRTPEREAFATYSRPLYRDRAFVVITRRDDPDQAPASQARPIRQWLSSPDRRLAVIGGYSYGALIDGTLRDLAPASEKVASPQNALDMIAGRRADLMILSPEEFEYYAGRVPGHEKSFAAHPIADVGTGSERHLICSKMVAPALLDQINAAIARREATPIRR